MTDKLSERMRRKMNYPHAKAGTRTALAWADEVATIEQQVDEAESERDMLRTVLNDTDKAELLEALEQSTKEALTLRERAEGLEKALDFIAHTGTDCPADYERDSFYRGQLHAAIAWAAEALKETT